MCGPADFGALQTCVVHIAELSAVGLVGYSACKAALLARKNRPTRERQDGKTPQTPHGRLIPEGPSGHSNT